MRIGFQRTPWDLIACMAYSLSVWSAILVAGAGNILSVPLLLLTPGYATVAVLYPESGKLDWLERLALSLGLSLVIIPLLGFALDSLPYGIGAESVVSGVTLFTGATLSLAYWRRTRLPIVERLSASFDVSRTKWDTQTRSKKAVTLGLAVAIIIASVALAYTLVAPPSAPAFTEFYVLGPNGNPSNYPSHLDVSQPGMVILGVVNHGIGVENYTLRVDLVGVQPIGSNTDTNQTVEVNRTSLAWFNLTLGSDQGWSQRFTFRIGTTGLWKVQFLLFKDGVLANVYRELHFYVTVT